MTAFAALLTPCSFGNAIQLGNRLWSKRVLPVGDIEYQGRTLHFTPAYIRGLADAFKSRAYDQVSFQLADSQNTHTNDPERHRGTIVDMQAQPDGLYITLEPTERGERILKENPYLGVSARIVEQYQRSDGTFFPAAVQHVLGTLDPRIPGLGAWQPVDMANSGAITIDLSNLSFSGEPAPAHAADVSLSPQELDDLISAIAEVDSESYGPDFSGAAADFDQAFSARARADAAREDARAAAIVEDVMHPARRDEDRMARIMARAQDGVYDGQQMSFAAEQAAVEITLANGAGPCGPLDPYGRCASRYHDLECGHGQNVDWLASGPPRSTYAASLANFADGLAIDLAPRTVWDDPDDYDQPPVYMPARTVELAHQLAHDWGIDQADVPGFPGTTTAFTDLLRPPGRPVAIEDELMAGMGYELPAADRPSYPGVAQLAQDLGLK
jgi:hypothetical protein